MAGRNHFPSHPLTDDPHMHRVPAPFPSGATSRLHPAIIEDRIVAQHREIQSLLIDNQRLAATHVALKQEHAVAHQEFRHISAAAANIKAERDAQVRDVYERSLKMEADARSVDGLNAELTQVRSDVQKLSAARQDLTAQLQAINSDLNRARAELQQVAISTLSRALTIVPLLCVNMGRAAVEYEKKTRADNLEQSQAMEKNMISMAREVEKLRAELANAEKRARATAAAAAAANPSPGYAVSYGNADVGYGGNIYADPYGMHQVQGGADAGPQYGSGAVSRGPYDMQQTYVHR
ncbi:hypothetical protein HHK36_010665 [Tetracentron sinense]|uniref:Protein FLC EXPRESSOR n=1 Tax=Tetracentron sinense TaxID=13715 RepID=A0A834ZCC9_TETSI|nr:hypothetical protein HHK36_010665 [Tetracentron sinense]